MLSQRISYIARTRTAIPFKGRTASQEEIETKEAELISELPKTEQEKRSYLASKYPLNPPEDFV